MTKADSIRIPKPGSGPKAPPKKDGEPTEVHCAKQFLRLNSVPKWMPQAKEGQDEIIRTLKSRCTSNKYVTVIMDWFLAHTTDCDNLVAELTKLSRSVREEAATELPAACANCQSNDFVEVPLKDGYYGFRRCSCVRGKALLDRDRKRFEDQRQRNVL